MFVNQSIYLENPKSHIIICLRGLLQTDVTPLLLGPQNRETRTGKTKRPQEDPSSWDGRT